MPRRTRLARLRALDRTAEPRIRGVAPSAGSPPAFQDSYAPHSQQQLSREVELVLPTMAAQRRRNGRERGADSRCSPQSGRSRRCHHRRRNTPFDHVRPGSACQSDHRQDPPEKPRDRSPFIPWHPRRRRLPHSNDRHRTAQEHQSAPSTAREQELSRRESHLRSTRTCTNWTPLVRAQLVSPLASPRQPPHASSASTARPSTERSHSPRRRATGDRGLEAGQNACLSNPTGAVLIGSTH